MIGGMKWQLWVSGILVQNFMSERSIGLCSVAWITQPPARTRQTEAAGVGSKACVLRIESSGRDCFPCWALYFNRAAPRYPRHPVRKLPRAASTLVIVKGWRLLVAVGGQVREGGVHSASPPVHGFSTHPRFHFGLSIPGSALWTLPCAHNLAPELAQS